MTENEIAIRQPDAPAEWGGREEVAALSDRIMTMMPGDLDRQKALLLAQYGVAMDANPFRGEVYAYEQHGKLQLVEGYKLLVRWARRQCNFYDSYKRMTGDDLPEGAIGFTCYVLREDAKDMLAILTGAGAPWGEAYKIVAQGAVGVVTHKDMNKDRGGPIPPPKGWTWDQVARKRALKNALNLAYGAPSPKEIARETWMVDDIETVQKDWPDDPQMLRIERERIAAENARNRERGGPDPRDEALPAERTRGKSKLFKKVAPPTPPADESYTDLFDEELPQEQTNGNVFICKNCGTILTDFEHDGKVFTVSQLVDIGTNLKAGDVLCGPCLKAKKESAKPVEEPGPETEAETSS